jgi:hypothetical protein
MLLEAAKRRGLSVPEGASVGFFSCDSNRAYRYLNEAKITVTTKEEVEQ